MMERLMKMPCHTIVTARVEPEGKVVLNDRQKEVYQETGEEVAEWGSEEKLRVHLWYDATTVIHLYSGEVKASNEKDEHIKITLPDGTTVFQMKKVWWAQLEKWKADNDLKPWFFDTSPEAIFSWIEKHNPTL
jgi:hypothetical protein